MFVCKYCQLLCQILTVAFGYSKKIRKKCFLLFLAISLELSKNCEFCQAFLDINTFSPKFIYIVLNTNCTKYDTLTSNLAWVILLDYLIFTPYNKTKP